MTPESQHAIPVIDVAPLFAAEPAAWRVLELAAAARDIGFAWLVVNFGQVLEQWSAGRIRATEHRVLGSGCERFSIPFFYEARADAAIAPLPVDRPDLFEPFEYGDFLWRRMTSFVEFAGMERERGERSEW